MSRMSAFDQRDRDDDDYKRRPQYHDDRYKKRKSFWSELFD